MTYSVQVGVGGYLGWQILQRTQEGQRSTLENTPEIQRSRDYFVEKAPDLTSAADLVSDYRLLNVALKAFGLEADIANRSFIRRVVEADASDKGSLVNKLSDKRYLALNQAFYRLTSDDESIEKEEMQDILNLFNSRSFERSLGKRHPELEIALNAQRELLEIGGRSSTDNAKWYSILSSRPLRKVFEGAFGLGSWMQSLPVDRQVQEIKAGALRLTGRSDASQFSDGKAVDHIIKQYLLRSFGDTLGGSDRFSTALELLRVRR